LALFGNTEFTVRLAVPVFWIVTFCVVVVPSRIFPKESVDGLTEIAGVGSGVPEPVKLTDEGEVGALLEMETLPAALPVLVGANLTVKLAEAPAATVAGVAIPETV
jgi:hypothetical protein